MKKTYVNPPALIGAVCAAGVQAAALLFLSEKTGLFGGFAQIAPLSGKLLSLNSNLQSGSAQGILIFAGVVLFSAFLFYSLNYFFSRVINGLYTHLLLKKKSSVSTQVNTDFLRSLKQYIAFSKRNKKSISLMGIKYKEDNRIIEAHGGKKYNELMAILYQAAQHISRKEEIQTLYHSNAVISLLLSGEKESHQAAQRFLRLLPKETAALSGSNDCGVSIGVFGYDFSRDTCSQTSEEDIIQNLLWGALDTVSRSQETGRVEIQFS